MYAIRSYYVANSPFLSIGQYAYRRLGDTDYGLPVYPQQERGNNQDGQHDPRHEGDRELSRMRRVLKEHHLQDPGVIIQGYDAVDSRHEGQPVDPRKGPRTFCHFRLRSKTSYNFV